MAASKTNQLRTGRRKTSVAQVKLTDGEGKITVNSKALDVFFKGCERFQNMAVSAIKAVKDSDKYNYTLKVNGGGISAQSGAIRHATARVLAQLSDENKKVLKKKGFLTRDSRMVERKKPGQPKARKKFQFSKR